MNDNEMTICITWYQSSKTQISPDSREVLEMPLQKTFKLCPLGLLFSIIDRLILLVSSQILIVELHRL